MSHRRPIIGITPGFAGPSLNREFSRTSHVLYCDEHYIRSITDAGGVPLILTHSDDPMKIERMISTMDGLLLTGGEDVNPLRYADEILLPEYSVAEERDHFEFGLLRTVMPTGKPILAICRGHQVVNVALGGSLIQDIPALIGSTHHVQTLPPPATVHDVEFEDGSRVARALGAERVNVNSYHHQAVDRLAPDLAAVGYSEEGLVEAMEHTTHPYLVGVQWHPERLCVDGLVHSRLFIDFVLACTNLRNGNSA